MTARETKYKTVVFTFPNIFKILWCCQWKETNPIYAKRLSNRLFSYPVETTSFYSVSLTIGIPFYHYLFHLITFFFFSFSCKLCDIQSSQFWDKDKTQKLWAFDYHGRGWSDCFCFDWSPDENNYSTFHDLGRKEAMKSGHHGFLITLPPAFKNPPDSKLQFQKQFELNTSRLLTSTDRFNNIINNNGEMIQLRLEFPLEPLCQSKQWCH